MADESFKQQWLASVAARHAHVYDTNDLAVQVQMLTQRNFELVTLVATLVDQLAAAGHVDPNVLLAQVEGQLEDDSPKPSARSKAPGPAAHTIHCKKCGREVPMAQAEMTGVGLVCGLCATA